MNKLDKKLREILQYTLRAGYEGEPEQGVVPYAEAELKSLIRETCLEVIGRDTYLTTKKLREIQKQRLDKILGE